MTSLSERSLAFVQFDFALSRIYDSIAQSDIDDDELRAHFGDIQYRKADMYIAAIISLGFINFAEDWYFAFYECASPEMFNDLCLRIREIV